jgi:hypothetical protein
LPEGAGVKVRSRRQRITPSVDLVNSDLDSVAAPLDDFDLVFLARASISRPAQF